MKTQVDSSHYFNKSYDSKKRFISYWYQINEIVNLNPKKILEIGIGNGFVSDYLKNRNFKISTMDIDNKLNPTVVGDVVNMQFPDKSFDVVACFETLEHLPYKDFHPALMEMFRVSNRYVILSLPDVNKCLNISVKISEKSFFQKTIIFPKLIKTRHKFDGEHYWEIGKRHYSLTKIIGNIQKAGFRIKKTYKVFENPYHRFFILNK